MAANPTDDTKPTVAERYSNATHASNLRMETREDAPLGASAVLIAMGWSPSRLGGALMRLHSEWDGCEHPKRPTQSAIELLALSMDRIGEGKNIVDHAGAHRRAHDWHMHELKLLFGKLKTMPEVRHQLVMWAGKQAIANPEHHVAEVLGWWLDSKCPACEGRAKERIANTPSLSHRDCKVCRGTGERRIPHKQGDERYIADTRRMLRHIQGCVQSAQTNLKQRLHAYRPKKDAS